MKKLICTTLLLITCVACNKQVKEYPKVTLKQITSELNWGMDYNSVNEVLTKKFGLEFIKELEQNEKSGSGKVFQYNGGIFNGESVNKWTAMFMNDSLVSLLLDCASEDESELKEIYSRLENSFNKDLLPFEHNVPDEKRWYVEKDGLKESTVLLTKRCVVLLSKAIPEN